MTKIDGSPAVVEVTAQEARILRRILALEATPEAIREFCRCRNQLSDYVYWYTLGTLWVSYTGFSNLDLWKRLFAANRPDRDISLMKPGEYRVFCTLPDEFTIYRAHRPGESDWIAYTVDPQIAGRFARERGVSQVHVYTVQRRDVLALFLRRGEREILVLDKARVQIAGVLDVVIQPESTLKETNL